MPLVFVHGITVRRDRFDRLLEDVHEGFQDAGSQLPVTGCFWGDLGRSTDYTGASIPGFLAGTRGIDLAGTRGIDLAGTRGTDGAGPPPDEAALLLVLLEDPLAELVRLRDAQEFGIDALGFRPVPPEVVQRNQALGAAATPVTTRLTAAAGGFTGPNTPLEAEQIASVVDAVVAEAARADRTLDVVQLTGPMARAITAGLYRAAVAEADLSGEFRWNQAAEVVQAALGEQLGGQLGVFTDLASDAFTLALRHGLRRRIMPGLSLFMGDVLAWFANRTAILQRVDQAVQEAGDEGPLVLVAHSLGGVIAFEWCMQADRDVELLATVGSQVGFFGELGVLSGPIPAASGKRDAPPRVGSWRNLYDPDDALAFLATPIFSGVRDIELNTGAPFPAAHSEYWNLSDTYAKLTAAVVTR